MANLSTILNSIGNAIKNNYANGSSSSSSSSKYTGSSSKNNSGSKTGSSSSGSSSSSSSGSGYKSGSGYANRESAFTWSDGSTTYSNATNWQDAAKEGGKQGLNLVNAVSYQSGSQQKAKASNSSNGSKSNTGVSYVASPTTKGQTGFTNNIYSKNGETGKNYTNALTYEGQVANAYNTNPSATNNGYGGYNTAGFGGSGAYGINGNPYAKMMDYVQNQYDDFEDQIIDLNRQSIREGAQRLENQKDSVGKSYEENARQAHINYLQHQHSLPEILSAQGITGGATETAQLSLQNAHQGSLSDINNALAQAINDIDNSIYELEQSGNTEMARQVLANSQSALSAYQSMMQNYVDYNYKANRDQLSDQRYNQEYDQKLQQYADTQAKYENSLKQDEYDRVLELINNGFTVNNASDILGVGQDEIDSYLSYLNQVRQLEVEKQQASIAKTLSTTKSKSSGGSSSKSSSSKTTGDTGLYSVSPFRNTTRNNYVPLNQHQGFASGYEENGVKLPGYKKMTLASAIDLYDEGNGPIKIYVNPSDYKIYFTA